MDKKIIKRKFTGEVISDKMDKTVVVKIGLLKNHPKYKKQTKVTQKFKAHDEKNEFKVGDKVLIEECRPLSAQKKWLVIKKVN
jgi:small subunit ribosomal protein S17